MIAMIGSSLKRLSFILWSSIRARSNFKPDRPLGARSPFLSHRHAARTTLLSAGQNSRGRAGTGASSKCTDSVQRYFHSILVLRSAPLIQIIAEAPCRTLRKQGSSDIFPPASTITSSRLGLARSSRRAVAQLTAPNRSGCNTNFVPIPLQGRTLSERFAMCSQNFLFLRAAARSWKMSI